MMIYISIVSVFLYLPPLSSWLAVVWLGPTEKRRRQMGQQLEWWWHMHYELNTCLHITYTYQVPQEWVDTGAGRKNPGKWNLWFETPWKFQQSFWGCPSFLKLDDNVLNSSGLVAASSVICAWYTMVFRSNPSLAWAWAWAHFFTCRFLLGMTSL